MKYIFVTGGVVSSLGKGLAAASIGILLEQRKLRVLMQKFDPYLNVDPGTMSPYQHGEVYVLDDGTETDLDLGHYERFTTGVLSKLNNLTSGQVFDSVIKKERDGAYLGKTVQFIPHVTDEIKARIHKVAEKHPDVDVLITEIGGTVGDMEALLFIEAIRQFALEVGQENVCFIHVTLLPFMKAAEELKTKPTQQSVAKLRELGIQPDIIICRSDVDLDEENRRKIAMFCNVNHKHVVPFLDVDHSIYECPLNLRRDKVDRLVVNKLGLGHTQAPDLTEYEKFVHRVIYPKNKVTIAVVGKYMEMKDAYKSIYESLIHAGAAHDTKVQIFSVDAEDVEVRGAAQVITTVDGILVPGGFGERGIEGKIKAVRYARERNIPFFGICLGMQVATIEFARNVCGLEGANSTEFNLNTPHPVVDMQIEQREITEKGASMRLGSLESILFAGTQTAQLYGNRDRIYERHRHRYEFNSDYREKMEEMGLIVSAVSEREGLVEMVEYPKNSFHLACQFHPEFQSKPNKPHPLFSGFVQAALEYQQK